MRPLSRLKSILWLLCAAVFATSAVAGLRVGVPHVGRGGIGGGMSGVSPGLADAETSEADVLVNSLREQSPTFLYVADKAVFQTQDGTASGNNDKVGEWEDQSGNGYHMLQATSANRPTYLASSIGGKPAIDFTGAPVFMEASIPAGTFPTGLTWIYLFQKYGALNVNGEDTVINRTVSATARPMLQMNTTRIFYQRSGTSTFSFATATSPTIFSQRANLALDRQVYEEWANNHHKFRNKDNLSANQDLATTLTLATRADRYSGGRFYLSAAIGFVGEISTQKRRAVEALLAARYGPTLLTPSANSINIVGHGDSIMKGLDQSTGLTAPWFKSLIAYPTLTAPGIVYSYNRGLAGAGFAYASGDLLINLVNDAATEVDASRITGITNYLIVHAGTNDTLGGYNGAQTYAAFLTWFNARIAAGWAASEIYVCTMLPRGAGNETMRTDYNALLVSGAATHGYNLVRLDLNANIGVAGANTNTTYYHSDQIHPNNAGHAEIFNEIKAVMFP